MKKSLIASMIAVGVASAPAHANLVTNGSFETGSFSGWTQVGPLTGQDVFQGTLRGYTPTDGTEQAIFGAVGTFSGIKQTLATTAGQTYTISFDLGYSDGTPNGYTVSFDGLQVAGGANIAGFAYTPMVYTAVASGSSAVLEFSFRHDPAIIFLDTIVVDAADVPEPAVLGLFGMGAVGLGLSRRRKTA